MYPTNHYMDPYSSYYRHHVPYPYYPPPGWEAGRPPMPPEADSSCRSPYGPWPYSGSMNQSGLPEPHSCCSHTYPPGYYSFRPPFPQELPPTPYPYYHGQFPPHHPTPYSSSYFGPLPPYPVDQTPYNGFYDKFKSHCCGCPNHVCHGDGGQKSNVKIEEHMPEVKDDSKLKGADNNSSIIRNPNYQYPVMWLPSGDMKDKANGRSFEFPPQLFSKWFPQSGERTEDVKPADDNQKEKQLQWPMVWMPPGYDETKQQAKKELKEIEQSPKSTQEDPPSPKIKIIPLSWFGNDHHDQKPAARDGSGDQNGRSSSAANQPAGTEHRHDTAADGNSKTIPVMPEKPTNGNAHAISVVPEKPNSGKEPAISVVPEKQDLEKKVRTCRTIPVISQKDSGEKKSYVDGNKEEKKASMLQKEGENKKSNNVESSKAKPSKLPPVCLRVDPLPKKKSGNTSSRSSNPATKKVCEKYKDIKEGQDKNKETKLAEHQKEGKMPIKEKSSDEIVENTRPRNVTVLDGSMKHAQEEQVSTSMTDQKVQHSVSAEPRENVSARSSQEYDKNRKEDEMKIQGKAPNLACEIKLSEPDAAVRIQSAYRGYHIRRWQPLEKLRKIKNVHKQMQDVEKQLQALEASSEQPTEKEHVAINETIMNLLLNLDTIQNLHPVVREARKSVARQLVCLQEKLDSLCKKLPAEPTNHPKIEEVSLTGVDEEQLPSSGNSNEPMHNEVSSEVSLKLSQDEACTEQKHQMEDSSTAKEEAQDEGKAAAATECQGVPPMDVICDGASSGHITEKMHQMVEPVILGEECTEEEKAAAKGEGTSALMEGSMMKQCTEGSAEQNCHTEESDQGVSPTAAEDGTTAKTEACMDGEVDADNDYSAAGGPCLRHDDAPAEDQCKEPSAPTLHLEDSSAPSKAAGPHENDAALADNSIIIVNPGDQQEEVINVDMQKEVADGTLDSDEEPTGKPTPPVGDTGNVDGVTGANSENTEEEKTVLVESETAKQCEVSGNDDSALVDQQNGLRVEGPAGGSTIVEEPEALPLETEDESMENTLNDATGEEPEAVPLEKKDESMENTLNDATGEEPEAVPLEKKDETMENTLSDATGEEPEAVPLEKKDETMENTLNDATGEEPEAVPLEKKDETMENTLNDATGEEPEAVPLEKKDESMENTLNYATGEEPEAVPLEKKDESMENILNDATGEEPEAVPLEKKDESMENTLNDATGEEPEAVPLENRVESMENTLNDAGCPENMSAEPALPESTRNGTPCEHDGGGAVYGDDPDSKVSSESHGDLQTEERDDGGELGASEATEGMAVETPACATGANSAVPVVEAEEEAAAATHDEAPKNKGVTDENEKLKEMVQKLLASGNEQMGVIAELGDKVRSLERKLAARKRRRPK